MIDMYYCESAAKCQILSAVDGDAAFDHIDNGSSKVDGAAASVANGVSGLNILPSNYSASNIRDVFSKLLRTTRSKQSENRTRRRGKKRKRKWARS